MLSRPSQRKQVGPRGADWGETREEAVVREEWGGKARTDRQPVQQSPGTPTLLPSPRGASLGAGPQLQVLVRLSPDQICRLEYGRVLHQLYLYCGNNCSVKRVTLASENNN